MKRFEPVEPRDPVAYPTYPSRLANARRVLFEETEERKDEPMEETRRDG